MSFSVSVDPTNPGQFFACCGLLELADRLWPGAEGWFAKDDREFHLRAVREGAAATALSLRERFGTCLLANTMTTEQVARRAALHGLNSRVRKQTPGLDDEMKALDSMWRESPLVLHEPFHLQLDWFADDSAGGSRFKTWAGQQSVIDIACAMKSAIEALEFRNRAPEDWLSYSVSGYGLPFNFDSDLGAQGGAIDVGFSFDPLAGSALTRIESSARPALELLAFIGLQRFRPTEIKGENRFLYTAWNQPLPVQVAMPAACGAMPVVGASRYEFRLLYRTKYLKSFLPAIPFVGGSDE